MPAGFLQEVVTRMPLLPGEAERSIFQPEQLDQATHDSHDSEDYCYLFATISGHSEALMARGKDIVSGI